MTDETKRAPGKGRPTKRNTGDQSTPEERVRRALESKGINTAEASKNGWTKHRCPAHDDKRASCGFSVFDDGGVAFKWHAGCDRASIIAALGLEERDLHLNEPGNNGANVKPNKKPRARANNGEAICPIPDSAPPVLPSLLKMEDATLEARYQYRDGQERLLFEVLRFKKSDGKKEIRPLTLRQFQSGVSWRPAALPEPRPLYGLDLLAARPEAEVLIVEGEKSADAARLLFPELVVMTWPGGASNPHKADWSPLAGRRVVLWPDADKPGNKAMREVARLAPAAGAAEVRMVELPEGLPEGWDLADEAPPDTAEEGLAAWAGRLIAEAAPVCADEPTPTSNRDRPVIVCSIDRYPTVDRAAATIAQDPRVFLRGAVLVEVGNEGVASAIAKPRLLELLGRLARWRKGEDYIPAPPWAAEMLLARPPAELPDIRRLTGILTAPTLRPDGSLLDAPGWDQGTGLLYRPAPGIAFPPVPIAPAVEDARRALEVLVEPLREFPWVAGCDRSGMLAYLLTLVLRHAIPGCTPLFGFTATAPRSGKGLLVELAHLIAYGRPPALADPPADPAEAAKQFLAVAIEGTPTLVLDNVTRPLGCGPLARVLTQRETTGRVLGLSKTATAPWSCVLAATGNGLKYQDDLAQRVVSIRLDPGVERPEERSFQRSEEQLRAHVKANRPELLSACLTLVRAYIVAGRPEQGLSRFGGFDEWSNLIRGALVFVGEPDPLEARHEVQAESDLDSDFAGSLLAAIEGIFGRDTFTAANAIQRAAPDTPTMGSRAPTPAETLRDALAHYAKGGRSLPGSRELGIEFRTLRGRIVAGRRIVVAGSAHGSANAWKVERIQTRAPGSAIHTPHRPHPPRVGELLGDASPSTGEYAARGGDDTPHLAAHTPHPEAQEIGDCSAPGDDGEDGDDDCSLPGEEGEQTWEA